LPKGVKKGKKIRLLFKNI